MIRIAVHKSVEVTPIMLAQFHHLFDLTYDQADHEYLDKSLSILRYIAVARLTEVAPIEPDDGRTPVFSGDYGQDADQLIGFALGETRQLDLPGLPAQQVGLAGLCCIDPRYRRRGLFRDLERSVIREGLDKLLNGRILAAGRMAHPASFRIMASNPTVVPKYHVTPTKFQQQVGQIVADNYGVSSFDPLTFVCKGSGHPIGYPCMTVKVDPEEWRVFDSVDRTNGDSLLALAWIPDAPRLWDDKE